MTNDLTRADWQFISFAVRSRILAARPKKGEPGYPTKPTEQETRIMAYLDARAFPIGGK